MILTVLTSLFWIPMSFAQVSEDVYLKDLKEGTRIQFNKSIPVPKGTFKLILDSEDGILENEGSEGTYQLGYIVDTAGPCEPGTAAEKWVSRIRCEVFLKDKAKGKFTIPSKRVYGTTEVAYTTKKVCSLELPRISFFIPHSKIRKVSCYFFDRGIYDGQIKTHTVGDLLKTNLGLFQIK